MSTSPSPVPAPDPIPSAPRATTITYLVALLLIASISITSHVLTNRIVVAQERTALLVNTAGRQRMLSQRITRIAEESADGSLPHAAATAQIRALADRMEAAQRQLIYGDTNLGLPPATLPELRTLYFGSAVHLQKQVADFLADARSFSTDPAPTLANPHLRSMVAAASAPLLNGLDAAVAAYQSASEHDIQHLRHIMNTLTITMLVVLVLEALLIYRPLFNRLTAAISLLISVSVTDFLTGVLNRRAFMTQAEREMHRGIRAGQPTCVLMVDLDHFKSINDTFGHAVGDLVLQQFAAIAKQSVRPGDLLGRVGGEEFCLLMPATDLAGGMELAETLRETIANTAVPANHQSIRFTASIGLLCATGGTLAMNLEQADALLYRAKHNGRNRVEGGSTSGLSSTPDSAPVRAI